jgi:D-alanyl-D-alanine carboxypeptidase
MSLAEDLLNTLNDGGANDNAESNDVEEPIIVDETRRIIVPNKLKTIAVMGDKNVETVTFKCIRYWDVVHDLSNFVIYINYILPNNTTGTYIPEIKEIFDDYFTFDWLIGREITKYNGSLTFLILARRTDNEGKLEYQWSSLLNSECTIAQGLEIINVTDDEKAEDRLTSLLEKYEQLSKLPDEVNKKLTKDTSVTDESKAYVKTPDGAQSTVDISSAGRPGSIMALDKNGQSNVAIPTEDGHIANKRYVDSTNNIFIPYSEIVEGKHFTTANNGNYTSYTGWNVLIFPVAPNGEYVYSGLSKVGNTPRSVFLDADGVFIFDTNFKQEVGTHEIKAPFNAFYVAFSVEDTDISSFKFTEKTYATQKQLFDVSDRLTDKEMFENGVFTSILVEGTINTSGELGKDSRRLRFSKTIYQPFKVLVNSGYLIRFIAYYHKETGEFYKQVTANATEFEANGEYGVRLVFSKTDVEATLKLTESANIFKNIIRDNGYSKINALPSPKYNHFARTRNPNPLLAWSDGYCWRNSTDNNLTIGATGYQTIKASDGSFVGGVNTDVAHSWASVTKVLNALVTVSVITDLSQIVTVIDEPGDYTNLQNAKWVQAGDMLSYRELLHSSLIQSDNNAARALGRSVGYVLNPSAGIAGNAVKASVVKMREIMEQIGMSNSTVHDHATMSGLIAPPEDVCKLLKYVQDNCPDITDIWGKLTYEMTVDGSNPRSWTIDSTTTSEAREKIPEFVGGKTGTSETHMTYAWVWRDKDDNEMYVSAFCDCALSKDSRFTDARQIMDEVYSLKS